MKLENIRLTKKQVTHFLAKIKVKKLSISIDFLNQIIIGIFTYIPFQNLTLIETKTRPTNQVLIQHMLLGLGGLCNVRNGFLYVLLRTLGFHVSFLAATIDKPDCHVILLVTLGEKQYLVDTGNGYPYLEAMELGGEQIYTHSYIKHRIIHSQEHLCLQHYSSQTWKSIFSFSLSPVYFSSFDNMLDRQYSTLGHGPFLTGIRLNKWGKSGGIIIRDQLCLKVTSGVKNERYRIKNSTDFSGLVSRYFQEDGWVDLLDVKKIWEKIYNENTN